MPGGIEAVSIKLPDFWHRAPEVWFARVEAQFGTKKITEDQTKFDYVVSALDMVAAEEIQAILLNPPEENKYPAIKQILVKTYGKTQAEKDAELLNLNGLGDKRPTALLRRINSLNDDPQTLKRALFLSNLPADMRTILAAQNIQDIEKLAEAADNIFDAKTPSMPLVQEVQSETPQQQVPDECNALSGARPKSYQPRNNTRPRPHRRFSGGSPAIPSNPNVCFFHSKFGIEARRCQPGCKFAPLVERNQQNSGNAPSSR